MVGQMGGVIPINNLIISLTSLSEMLIFSHIMLAPFNRSCSWTNTLLGPVDRGMQNDDEAALAEDSEAKMPELEHERDFLVQAECRHTPSLRPRPPCPSTPKVAEAVIVPDANHA